MTPTSMMLYFGIAGVVGFIITAINMATMMGNRGNTKSGWFLIHLLFGAVFAVGFFGTIGGFVWFLLEKSGNA